MTLDEELEAWRAEWRHGTEPLPALKRKIMRDNLRVAISAIIAVTIMAVATVAAVRTHSPSITGFAVGLGATIVVLGGYVWWIRRGTWRPTEPSTRAYVELAVARAVAKVQTMRVVLYGFVGAIALEAGLVVYEQIRGIDRFRSERSALILALMVVALLATRLMARRVARELAELQTLRKTLAD